MIRPFRFRHNPVRSLAEVTGNFEQLEPKLPYNTPAIAYRSALQGIPNNVHTRCKLDTALSDPFGLVDLTKGWYRAPATGYYQANFVFLIAAVAASDQDFQANIYVNETRRVAGHFLSYKGGAEVSAGSVASGIVSVRRGDHIEGWVYQKSGAERNLVAASPEYNQLSVVRVA